MLDCSPRRRYLLTGTHIVPQGSGDFRNYFRAKESGESGFSILVSAMIAALAELLGGILKSVGPARLDSLHEKLGDLRVHVWTVLARVSARIVYVFASWQKKGCGFFPGKLL